MRKYSETWARHAAALSIAKCPYPVRLLIAIASPVTVAVVAERLLTWLPLIAR